MTDTDQKKEDEVLKRRLATKQRPRKSDEAKSKGLGRSKNLPQ